MLALVRAGQTHTRPGQHAVPEQSEVAASPARVRTEAKQSPHAQRMGLCKENRHAGHGWLSLSRSATNSQALPPDPVAPRLGVRKPASRKDLHVGFTVTFFITAPKWTAMHVALD